jgi:hypothetical protein
MRASRRQRNWRAAEAAFAALHPAPGERHSESSRTAVHPKTPSTNPRLWSRPNPAFPGGGDVVRAAATRTDSRARDLGAHQEESVFIHARLIRESR